LFVRYLLVFIVNAARRLNPSLPPGHPEAVPKSDSQYLIRYDTSKAARILKVAPKHAGTSKSADGQITYYYRSMDEVTKDTLAYFEKKGW